MKPGLEHICIISHHNVAELLGAILPNSRAACVHLVVSREMQAAAAAFRQVCASYNLPCYSYILNCSDVTDIMALLEEIHTKRPNSELAVNITGGTKLMSLAAYMWAFRSDVPAFYVDSTAKNIQIFQKQGRRVIPLPDLLSYEDLLGLYGYSIIERNISPLPGKVDEATCKISRLLRNENGKDAIHELNFLLTNAGNELDVSYTRTSAMHELLVQCKKAGKLDYDERRILLFNEKCRGWCRGHWLEDYVHGILVHLEKEGKIRSWATAVKVEKDGVENELDGIFTANNRLYILECKTTRLLPRFNGQKHLPAVKDFYKADSIRASMG